MSVLVILAIFVYIASCVGSPYLVSLQNSETMDAFMTYDLTYPSENQLQQKISHSFSIGNFSGFIGDFSEQNLARLKRCPLILDVTPDQMIHAYGLVTQERAPRHLARISRAQRMWPGIKYPYIFDCEHDGRGVNAYVVDSGVELNHPEFEGRAVFGKDLIGDGSGDVNGHGTHVAGLIGSRTYGLSKGVNIIEVKALNVNGSGTLSNIVLALEFAVNHRRESGKNGVVNLSLGSVKNFLLDNVISEAAKTGLVVVAAAGNSNIDACLTSPASSVEAITVGAIDDMNDSVTVFSNWGDCVDIYASGSSVPSVNINHPYKPLILSGTSMAAPIVSGLVANLLSEGIQPENVKQALISRSVKSRMYWSTFLQRRRSPTRIACNQLNKKDN